MSFAPALLLVPLATAPVLDALRRRGALARPEFYLLATLYLYATGGYLTYLTIPAGTRGFLLPAGDLAVHTSYLYSTCALIAVYVGSRLYDPGVPEGRVQPSGNRVLVTLALVGCALALAANVYYFYSFGLFSGGANRVEFIDDFDTTGGAKVPYLDIFYASIAVLALNERRPVSLFALSGLALLHLPVGNRRIVLAALIIVLVAKLLGGARLRKRVLAAVGAVVLVVGVVVGDVRGEGLSALSGLDLGRVLLALSEFARPFVTLVYYVENGYEPLYGASLLNGFINTVPSFLLPVDKVPSPGREFVDVVESLGVFGEGRVPGFGFFPVAEALLNFGPVGVPVFFLLFAPIVRWLSVSAARTGIVFVVPVLCAYMFAFGRNPFGNVLAACLWAFAVGFAMHLMAKLVGYAMYDPAPREGRSIVTGARPETEFSLLDLLSFLRNNLRTLVPLTLLFAAIGVATVFLLPREYQKQLTMTVLPVSSALLGRFEEESGGLDLEALRPDEAGELAVGYLEDREIPGVEVAPDYARDVQQLQVSMTSGDTEALREAPLEVISAAGEGFQDVNEEALGAALEGAQIRFDRNIEINRQVLDQLQAQLDGLPEGEEARRAALEAAQIEAEVIVSTNEIRLRDLEQAREDLPSLASELVSIEVVEETEVSQSGSPAFSAVLASIGGFAAAVFATLGLSALRKSKK